MFLRPSTTTFAEAKAQVLESAGIDPSKDTDSADRAGRAIQAAFREWNAKANWKWLRTTANPISVVANTDTYTLPANCKAVHSVRMEGDFPRTIPYVDRRLLNNVLRRQDITYTPFAYDLFRSESEGGKIRLINIPNRSETMVVDYYRAMTVPCAVTLASETIDGTLGVTNIDVSSTKGMTTGSRLHGLTELDGASGGIYITRITSATSLEVTQWLWNSPITGNLIVGGDTEFLDIPADYESGVLATATYKYLINKAGGGTRLDYWRAQSEAALTAAIAENLKDTPDQELAFMPPYYYDTQILSPNDIRWADMGW